MSTREQPAAMAELAAEWVGVRAEPVVAKAEGVKTQQPHCRQGRYLRTEH